MNSPAVIDVPLRYCRRCEAERPSSECRSVTAGSGTLLVCPACGMVTREVVTKVERSLTDQLTEAVKWPAMGDNWITWAALGVGVTLFSKVPVVGGLLSSGALWSYLFVVIQRGSRGEEDAPAMADFVNWWSLVIPLLQSAAALFIPLLPMVLSVVYLSGAVQLFALLLSALWAVALAPAAIASVAFEGSFVRAVNPMPMVALVTRIPREYATTVGVLALLTFTWFASWWFAVRVSGALTSVLWAAGKTLQMVADAVLVFFPLAMARVVAVMLRERADVLGIEPLPRLSR